MAIPLTKLSIKSLKQIFRRSSNLFQKKGMACLKHNEGKEDNAKKVAGQPWWAITRLGRQLKGKNTHDKGKRGKNDKDEEEDEEGEEEGEKEMEVILLSNRQPRVEQLGQSEVCFSFLLVREVSTTIFF